MQWTLLDLDAVLFSIYNLPLWTLCGASKEPGLVHIETMSLLQQKQEDVSKDASAHDWSKYALAVCMQHWHNRQLTILLEKQPVVDTKTTLTV